MRVLAILKTHHRRVLGTLGVLTVAAIYIAAAWWAVLAYRGQVNPDGVGYVSVAQRWLAGDWFNALNGYWSPLLSWMMMPLLASGVSVLMTARIVQAVAGAMVIAGADRVLAHLGVGRDLRFWFALALIPVVLWHAMTVTTPDVLIAGALLWYMAWQARSTATSGFGSGLVGGLLIGVAYLAKAYALPFAVMHFGLVNGWALLSRQRRRAAMLTVAGGALGTCLIALPWAGALSWKYGRAMIADTGRYNWQLNGPTDPGQPMHTRGLLAPSHEYAYSAWDDPTYLQLEPWSPWRSGEERAHLWKLLNRNIVHTWTLVNGAVPFLAVWAVGGLIVACGHVRGVSQRAAAVIAAGAALYPLGYWFTHLELRFLLLLIVLAVVFAAMLLELVSQAAFAKGLVRRSLLAAALGAAIAWPLIEHLQRDVRPSPQSQETLAMELRDLVPRGARIASTDPWSMGLYAAYYNDYRYYGTPARHHTTQDIHHQLREMDIEYVLQWPSRSQMQMDDIAELVGTWHNVRIWKMTPVTDEGGGE
jgi:hypothetical protein